MGSGRLRHRGAGKDVGTTEAHRLGRAGRDRGPDPGRVLGRLVPPARAGPPDDRPRGAVRVLGGPGLQGGQAGRAVAPRRPDRGRDGAGEDRPPAGRPLDRQPRQHHRRDQGHRRPGQGRGPHPRARRLQHPQPRLRPVLLGRRRQRRGLPQLRPPDGRRDRRHQGHRRPRARRAGPDPHQVQGRAGRPGRAARRRGEDARAGPAPRSTSTPATRASSPTPASSPTGCASPRSTRRRASRSTSRTSRPTTPSRATARRSPTSSTARSSSSTPAATATAPTAAPSNPPGATRRAGRSARRRPGTPATRGWPPSSGSRNRATPTAPAGARPRPATSCPSTLSGSRRRPTAPNRNPRSTSGGMWGLPTFDPSVRRATLSPSTTNSTGPAPWTRTPSVSDWTCQKARPTVHPGAGAARDRQPVLPHDPHSATAYLGDYDDTVQCACNPGMTESADDQLLRGLDPDPDLTLT